MARCMKCDKKVARTVNRSVAINKWRGVAGVCSVCAKTLRKPKKGKSGLIYKPKTK